MRHPDRAFVSYIIRGLGEGFRTGFQWGAPLVSVTSNMLSTRLRPGLIGEYISKELGEGRMIGPLPMSWRPIIHLNRVGLVPKGHNSGKFRLITDLSFPHGASANDGISPDLVSLSYIAVDDVAAIVQELGKGSLLAKMDIEAAYRLIPVHPHDRVLQGMEWDGRIYVDPCLPFGLRSAPKIFNVVADGLCWCLRQAGIQFVLHYLDDFIIVAPPDTDECARSVTILEETCAKLGVPMAPGKSEGPLTSLVFLGILVDTEAGELRLPEGKLQRLKSLLQHWGARRACRRRELELLVGLLNHACKVVRSGRSFLRRLFDLLHQTGNRPEGHSMIRLSNVCRGTSHDGRSLCRAGTKCHSCNRPSRCPQWSARLMPLVPGVVGPGTMPAGFRWPGTIGHMPSQLQRRSWCQSFWHVQHGGRHGTPARSDAGVTIRWWCQPFAHGRARTRESCTSSGALCLWRHGWVVT